MTFNICVYGELGNGKTLTMTALGYYFKNKGYDVYSNYYTTFSKLLPMEVEDFINFFENINENVKNLFLIDEIYVFIDSRVSASVMNRAYASIMLQTRKKSTNIIYTAQDPYSVEKRLRIITNYYFYPKLDKEKDKIYVMISDMSFEPIRVITINNASKFYGMYNTKQIIKSEDLYDKVRKRKGI